MDDDEFMKQFTGSASANVVTVLLFGILMLLKTCLSKNHSKCHSFCIDLEIENDEKQEDSDSESVTEEGGRRMRRLHGKHNKDLQKQHEETV